jgi:hypothetical protein
LLAGAVLLLAPGLLLAGALLRRWPTLGRGRLPIGLGRLWLGQLLGGVLMGLVRLARLAEVGLGPRRLGR